MTHNKTGEPYYTHTVDFIASDLEILILNAARDRYPELNIPHQPTAKVTFSADHFGRRVNATVEWKEYVR